MEMTVYNTQKGRYETPDITINETTSTWFDDSVKADDMHMITDTNDGLLIRENGYSYPVPLYDLTRADIAYDQQKAKTLLNNVS